MPFGFPPEHVSGQGLKTSNEGLPMCSGRSLLILSCRFGEQANESRVASKMVQASGALYIVPQILGVPHTDRALPRIKYL